MKEDQLPVKWLYGFCSLRDSNFKKRRLQNYTKPH